MSLRGRPSRSIALAATMSAWVRVEPAAHADDDLRAPDRLQPLFEPRDLDVVRLVAVEREALLVVGHEGEAVDLSEQPDVIGRRGSSSSTVRNALDAVGEGAPVVVEGALAQTLLAQ